MSDFPNHVDIVLGVYFGLITVFQGVLLVASLWAVRRARGLRYVDTGAELLEPTRMPPVALIVPCFNEAETIADSVRALTQIDYPGLEILVVNDGSRDETIKVLKRAFKLRRAEIAGEGRLKHELVRDTFRSGLHPRLSVIDKVNGGKADALNAGIEHTLCPLVCCIDADTIVDRQAITRLVEPFLTSDPPPQAVGGIIQIANDSRFEEGLLQERQWPRNWLARNQALEYLRAFLFFRTPMARWNANLIISGALGLFRRSAVLEVGGYETATVGEDMELVVRLHRQSLEKGQSYDIAFRSDAVAYTECPEKVGALVRQRDRWQRGLIQTLLIHRRLSFRRNSVMIGWFVIPFFWIFEVVGPFVELFATSWWAWGVIGQRIPVAFIVLMLVVATSLNLLVSLHTLLLDDLDGRRASWRTSMGVLSTAFLEPLRYRPIVVWARILGTWKYIRGDGSWGSMKRRGFKTEGSST
ncbi:MAG: glycosyltransferase [Myxococcota bacterium]